jgi:hypothetical protein
MLERSPFATRACGRMYPTSTLLEYPPCPTPIGPKYNTVKILEPTLAGNLATMPACSFSMRIVENGRSMARMNLLLKAGSPAAHICSTDLTIVLNISSLRTVSTHTRL